MVKIRKKGEERLSSTMIKRAGNESTSMRDLLLYNQFMATHQNVWKWENHFQHSLQGKKRKTITDPMALSKTLLYTAAIEQICNGVAELPWTISSTDSTATIAPDDPQVKMIKRGFNHPNSEEGTTYKSFIKAIVKDLLVFNLAAVERNAGDSIDDTRNHNTHAQAFWLWSTCPKNIHLNTDWTPQFAGVIPRYYFIEWQTLLREPDAPMKPLLDRDLFIIKNRTSTWEYNPDSPVITAYKHINTWLKLSEGQDHVVENPIRNHLIALEDSSDDQVGAFRQYWKTHVLGNSAPPIVRGKINVQKIAAETDEELFLKFTEYLVSLIALAFALSKRDFNLTDHDNRATSEASADSSFQKAILPIARTVMEHFNNEVVAFFTEHRFEITLGELETRKQDVEAKISETIYKAGFATKNEARKRFGLSEIEGGDIFYQEEQAVDQESDPQSTNDDNVIDRNANQSKQTAERKEKQKKIMGDDNSNNNNASSNGKGQNEKTIQASRQLELTF